MAANDSGATEFDPWRSHFQGSYWEFARRVRQNRRYVWDEEVRAFLETVIKTRSNRDIKIPVGSILWRAQLGIEYYDPSDGEIGDQPFGFSAERMKPLSDSAREGRANSTGIPVLYLASTEQTAISEVRPWVGSEISVAQFRVVRDLKAIDLSLEYGKSSFFTETKEKALWIDIDNAFSHPVSLPENTADYVPTQILAELFLDASYDAMIYRSQFGENGYNIAFFNIDDAEIINCAPYKVSTVEVKYEQVGNRWFSKGEYDYLKNKGVQG